MPCASLFTRHRARRPLRSARDREQRATGGFGALALPLLPPGSGGSEQRTTPRRRSLERAARQVADAPAWRARPHLEGDAPAHRMAGHRQRPGGASPGSAPARPSRPARPACRRRAAARCTTAACGEAEPGFPRPARSHTAWSHIRPGSSSRARAATFRTPPYPPGLRGGVVAPGPATVRWLISASSRASVEAEADVRSGGVLAQVRRLRRAGNRQHMLAARAPRPAPAAPACSAARRRWRQSRRAASGWREVGRSKRGMLRRRSFARARPRRAATRRESRVPPG